MWEKGRQHSDSASSLVLRIAGRVNKKISTLTLSGADFCALVDEARPAVLTTFQTSLFSQFNEAMERTSRRSYIHSLPNECFLAGYGIWLQRTSGYDLLNWAAPINGSGTRRLVCDCNGSTSSSGNERGGSPPNTVLAWDKAKCCSVGEDAAFDVTTDTTNPVIDEESEEPQRQRLKRYMRKL